MVLRDDNDAYWRRDIEQRLAALEGAPQVGYQSITEGGIEVRQAGQVRLKFGIIDGRACLEVYDALGVPQIRAGELESGGYGLEAISDGIALPIASLLFGIRSSQVSTSHSLADTGGAFVDLPTAGPSVTVTVSDTGRLLILGNVRMTTFLTNTARFAYTLSGANTAPATSLGWLKLTGGSDVNGAVSTVGGIEMLEDLNPGVTTVTLKYLTIDTSPGGVAPNFIGDRNLVAIPF